MNKINSKKLQLGFTLLDMVVSIAIFAILAIGLLSMISGLFTSNTQQSKLLSDIDQARKVAFNFTNEVRNATTGNDGSYPLNEAANQEIIFFTPIGSSGLLINRVRYYISGTTLYKGVIVPTGNPLTYNPANEISTAIQNDVGNGNNPLFYYYDGTYTGSGSALSQPVNLNQVKFVKINLMITNEGGVANNSTDTVTNGATIRNLKTNLGS